MGIGVGVRELGVDSSRGVRVGIMNLWGRSGGLEWELGD